MRNEMDEIFDDVRKGEDREKLAKKLKSRLNSDQRKKLEGLLGDKNALKKLMNSPKVKEIINKITEEDNGQFK